MPRSQKSPMRRTTQDVPTTSLTEKLPFRSLLVGELLASTDPRVEAESQSYFDGIKRSMALVAATKCLLVLLVIVAFGPGKAFDPTVAAIAASAGLSIAMLVIGRLLSAHQALPHVKARWTTIYALLAGVVLLPALGPATGDAAWQHIVTIGLAAVILVDILSLSGANAPLLVYQLSLTLTYAMSRPTMDATIAAMILPLIAFAAVSQRAWLRALRNARRNADQREALRALYLLRVFEEYGKAWFWETDAQGRLIFASSHFIDEFSKSEVAPLTAPFSDLAINDAQFQDSGSGGRTLSFHLSTRLPFTELEVRANLPGEPRYWSLTGRPVFDEFNRFLGFRGMGEDLTAIRRSEDEIVRLARYDALTGLPNRVYMRQTLEAAMNNGNGGAQHCALFLLDLDRFKNVNDTLGHPIGDILLKQVADRLNAVLGDDGRVGRLGGDEFQCVLPRLNDRARLAELAKRIIERLSVPYSVEGNHISIGASLGIAIAPEDGMDADALIRNADLALYAAKADGKGVHRFYQTAMHTDANDRQSLENDLRHALAQGQFRLAYQPVVDARSELVSGFEALIRWEHPQRGFISPSEFIPVAEEIGLIGPIGEWVLRTACREAAGWPEDVRIAVNVSPIQFASASLPATITSALAESGLTPKRLELEITEGVFLHSGDSTDAMFASLSRIGVRFALDDFGTGYSSLGYLKRAPFNKIKIDQSFVRGASIDGNRNAAIIKSIVSLAQSLDMDTTAEGVETHDELALIRELGCSHVQGFIFGRPMSGEQATQILVQSGRAQASGFTSARLPRIAMLRTAQLHHAGRAMPVRLRNISEAGAMLEVSANIAPASRVELELVEGERVPGEVRWNDNGRLGLQFDGSLDLEMIQAGRTAPIQFGRSLRRVSPDTAVEAAVVRLGAA